MEAFIYALALYFAFGYAIERERRCKLQKKIHNFYNAEKV